MSRDAVDRMGNLCFRVDDGIRRDDNRLPCNSYDWTPTTIGGNDAGLHFSFGGFQRIFRIR